eukprot:TRINITY_DN9046_c0_g1_i1.p1 TRINITY_DN9046_c0_g1~~TRINITY_DN9046_c0_g1_i1.p1  ORF type:complete len:102 (-),score=21.09 TRINITY_DN9046_c0_g1_i1:213-518(-)
MCIRDSINAEYGIVYVVMRIQRTLGILKPDVTTSSAKIKEVFSLLEKNNFRVVKRKEINLTREVAEQFYAEHRGRFFFPRLVFLHLKWSYRSRCSGKRGSN